MTPAPQSSFDDLACDYDRYCAGYADEVYDALEEYGLVRGLHVLDVGCGTGLASGALVERGLSVVGIDSSEPMLARARARIPAAKFLRARAEDLPFGDASFDGAVSAQAFHWFDQRRALRELIRVVRPGGAVGIWWKALMRGDTTRLLREEVAQSLGLHAPVDLAAQEFEAFEGSALLDRRLRVVPWVVHTTAGEFLGHERSRKRALDA
ncbi:MAG: class I SAM-dependent methyltransferase, partial [Candidatus Eremiobacteraeota bacterium]|nr:class I SAM-dependent methyltransferase [Candidatus Eremiobacteraeota bacterium]